MEHTNNHSPSVVVRFFISLWNVLMKGLVAVGVMPAFRKRPWLHAVLIFFIMAAAPYIGLFVLIAALIASGNGAKAANNYMATASDKSERFMGAQSDEEEREAYQGEAMLRAYENGVPIEDAMKLHDAMGKLYDRQKMKQEADQ